MTELQNRAILNLKIVLYSNIYWNRLFKDYMRDCYVFLHISHAFFYFDDSGKKSNEILVFFPLFYWSKGEGAFDIN